MRVRVRTVADTEREFTQAVARLADFLSIIGLIALPYVDRSRLFRPRHRKVAVTTFTTFLVLWIVLTLIGFMFRGPNWGWVWPWEEWHGVL